MAETLLAEGGNSATRVNVFKNPHLNRVGEIIGGGFFVVRRGRRTGRICLTMCPFEHPSMESAGREAERLARRFPDRQFDVLGVVASFRETADLPAEATPSAASTAPARRKRRAKAEPSE